jgi:hypothetical protein
MGTVGAVVSKVATLYVTILPAVQAVVNDISIGEETPA